VGKIILYPLMQTSKLVYVVLGKCPEVLGQLGVVKLEVDSNSLDASTDCGVTRYLLKMQNGFI
jgi:hypothetical protein